MCSKLWYKMLLGRTYPTYSRRFCSKLSGKSTSTTSSKWRSVVGLEVHAQIQSNSKLFSGSSTKFSSPINSNASLFDIATPGTLPVLNKRCVEAGVLTALSLNCSVNSVSYFDRKHYFYADMPSGYQITQQRAPLASDGSVDFHVFTPGVHKAPYKKTCKIKQVQLEQDSGKSLHDVDKSLVDLNRAGVPLMELVFEPDLADGEEAAALIKELTIILQRINTCSCKMEEGALRVDANVSIHKEGEPFGTRTEIKNIGSIRGVAAAVKYEIERQIQLRENNGVILNETRSWNPEQKITVSMRDKEVQQDYRYMPEPNLPPLHIAMGPVEHGFVNADKIRESIPELPEHTRTRLKDSFNLTQEQCYILVNNRHLQKAFEEALLGREISPIKLANFLINDLFKVLNEQNLEVQNLKFSYAYLGEIMELIENGSVNRDTAVKVLDELIAGNAKTPVQIVEDNHWKQLTDEKLLRGLCQKVIEENEKAVKDYLSGKKKAYKFIMKVLSAKAENRADMKKCDQIMKELLSELNKKM